MVEAGGHARQVALGREDPREDLVHDGVADPVRDGAGGLARPVPAVAGLAPDGVRDRARTTTPRSAARRGEESRIVSPMKVGSIHIAGAGEDGAAAPREGEAHVVLATPAVGTLEGEHVVAGEGRRHAGEGGAGVLVHLEVLAAGVLRDLPEARPRGSASPRR